MHPPKKGKRQQLPPPHDLANLRDMRWHSTMRYYLPNASVMFKRPARATVSAATSQVRHRALVRLCRHRSDLGFVTRKKLLRDLREGGLAARSIDHPNEIEPVVRPLSGY